MLDLDEFFWLLAPIRDVASLRQVLSASDVWQGRLRAWVVVPGEAPREGMMVERVSEQVYLLPGSKWATSAKVRDLVTRTR
jgi:hypothetical protein